MSERHDAQACNCGGTGVAYEPHEGGVHPVHCSCTYTPAQPCACGSPDATSLKPGEVVTHTADACWIGVAEGGE